MKAATNLTDRRFGRLLVVERAGSKDGNAAWRCNCDCGNTVVVKSNNLLSGNSKSCGCLEKEQRIARMTTHNLTNTKLYKTWESMKKRCYYQGHKAYKNYGGKGVTICNDWRKDFRKFYDWAIKNGYAEGLTIDRIDPRGNYEPNNCQWLTRSENTRKAWADRRSNLCVATEKS